MPSTAEFSPLRRGAPIVFSVPVAASTKIYKGTLVGVNAGGYLVPASTAATKARAVATATVDNTGGANGALLCEVETHAQFRFANDPTNAATQAHVGATLKVSTGKDETATNSGSGTASAIDAGVLAGLEVDSGNYIWLHVAW